jgi:hypothetical protein
MDWPLKKLGDFYTLGAQISSLCPFMLDIDRAALRIPCQIIPRFIVVALLVIEKPFHHGSHFASCFPVGIRQVGLANLAATRLGVTPYSSKKSLHGTDWRFQCREVGDYRVQSSGVAASCLVNKRQFGK